MISSYAEAICVKKHHLSAKVCIESSWRIVVSFLSWQTTREHQSVTGDLGQLQYPKDPGPQKVIFPIYIYYIPILGRGCFDHQYYDFSGEV